MLYIYIYIYIYRDDAGNVIPFGNKGSPQADHSVIATQDYIANLSISLFHDLDEAKTLLDGVMVDGINYMPSKFAGLVSPERYEKLFEGMMTTMTKMQAIHTANRSLL